MRDVTSDTSAHEWLEILDEPYFTTSYLLRVLTRRSLSRLNSRAVKGTFAAFLVIPVVLLGLVALRNSAAVSDVQAAQLESFQVCPMSNCANYPQPAKIKGITIAALQNWLIYNKSVRSQIRTAKGWGANTIRLQILQDKLVGAKGRSFSPRYMATIKDITNFALKHKFTVVLNAQTEISTGFPWNENLPTHATTAFWEQISQVYGGNPHVIFDLFNEPRFCSWAQWQAAFQPLVTQLRTEGALNQFWVEGRWWGSTLEDVPLLKGQGLVYSYHHPGSPWPWQAPVGPATWDSAFGDLAQAGVPVVDGEFVNFMGGYYWPHSTQMVSQYLRYLNSHHIGTVAWSLQPGIMTATGNMNTAVSEPQGAGRLIWRYFHNWLPKPAPIMTENVHFRWKG